VAFLGNAPWSVASLEALAGSGHEVVAVLTREPRPAGRGHRLSSTAVAMAADSLGLPLREVVTIKSGAGFDALTAFEPDVLAVVAYGEILPSSVLAIPRIAPVNVHFSLLPALRGAAPVQRAILDGLTVTGVTTMRIDDGLDTGPILLRSETPIGPDEDAGSLGRRLAVVGGELLVRTLDGLAEGSLVERPQDASAATLAPRLTAEDRTVDWSRPAAEIVRRIRALAPEPGAATRLRGKRLKLLRASRLPAFTPPSGTAPPGAVFEIADERSPGVLLAVATGHGVISVDELQAAGGRRMTGQEFLRGHHLEPGEVLG
jgi:methionyl-tRNA formyltransferase